MLIKENIERLSPEDGISFLEHLAHNLTIAVRTAAASRKPYGSLTEEETRKAMYWINEALHNVVQLTRDLRIGRENWEAQSINKWVELWIGYKNSTKFVKNAVEHSFRDLVH